jgi:hypothetical protein
MAALLTRISSPPSADTAASTERAIASGSALSAWMATARCPVLSMDLAIVSAFPAECW